MGGERGSRL